jgi:hypothetical protein
LGGLRKVQRFFNLQNKDGALSSQDGSKRISAGTLTDSDLTWSKLGGGGQGSGALNPNQ